MAELGDFLVSGDTTVNIDVEMLDYGFIEKCDDAKTLRGIIDTLKSGKEGIYPELCQAAENRLFAVIPEKERKRILRLKHQTTPDQIHDAECDLNSWQTEVFAVDKELLGCKTEVSSTKTKKIPPVRGQKVEKLDIPGPVPSKAPAGNIKSEDDSASSSLKSQRLSGYDFHAWEKFNVDEALATLDEEEEELENDALTKRLKNKRIAEEAAKKRVERHTKALEVLRVEMNIENMSTVQRKTRAAREKQKGNESFRSGENEEAYTYYSRSLALDDSVAAVYSNRALVCLRTGKLETAEDDCSRALFLEPGFTKARSRRGIARLKSGKYELAILDFEYALEYDSTNKELVSLLQKAKDKYLEVEGKEYVSKKERERQDAALRLALANGMPVKVTSSSSSEALLLPVASASVELVSSGVCGMIADPSEKLTRITIEDDSASSDDEEHGVESGGFTRIVIDEDSDSEDEDNVDDGVIAQDKTAAPVDNSSSTNGFVRIAITDDSDSDSDSNSENNEQHEVVADKVSQVQIAEKLKSQANEAMQGGDLSKAIRLYTECIAIDATSQVGIAACGNRSLANLKLKNYANVLEDTNLVLTHDPFNLKALYRRAMAFEATNDLDSAIKDVNSIVHIQPQNELALEARERFLSAQKAAIVETNDIDVAAKSTPIESDWEVVSSTDSGKVSTVPADLEKGNELKNLGNEAMKAGRIEEAVDFYSQAITCDSSNVLFYNNRAQAYIKIGQFKKAEVDATHVIDHNTDDAPNFKAYYRRALARKGLNTSTSLKGAQGDIAFILTHEPNNKAAIIENQKIGKLLKAIVVKKKDESIITKEPVKSGSITSSGLTEVSSKKVKARSDTPLSSQPSLSSQSHESPRSEVSTKKPAANVPTTSKTKAAKDITVKNPTVPEAPPKTVYEFERIWRGLKNRPDLFAIYLKCFKKSTFKKVLKETCSPDLLSSMLVSVRDHLLASERREDVEKGVSVLDGLASIPKYDMVRFVLPEADLECLKSCLDFVNVHVGAERASNLRNKLKV